MVEFNEHQKGLNLLNISFEEWNELSPEQRKAQYHKKIICEIFKKSPG